MKTHHTFSILFWINRSKAAQGLAPIYIRITVNGKRAELSLKRSIAPEKWNSHAENAKGNSEEMRTLNLHIAQTRVHLEKIHSQLLAEESHITAEEIKSRYLGKHLAKRTLLTTVDYHNKLMEQQAKNGEVENSTLDKFKVFKKRLEAYILAEFNKSDVALTDLDHPFLAGFEQFLKSNFLNGHNAAMFKLKQLKKVVNMAVMNNWIDRNPFFNSKLKILEVKRQFLTSEELDQFSNIPLSGNLEKVRDIFLFQCYTGYAYSEVSNLKKSNLVRGIDGNPWISIQRKKTKKKTAKMSNVPLLPQAWAILEKYKDCEVCKVNNTLLPNFRVYEINSSIRLIAGLCGIDKKLTSHIGRHTFATTVTLANGVPIETISSMLGHSDISTTQIYAKMVDSRVGEDMQKLAERLAAKTISNHSKVGG